MTATAAGRLLAVDWGDRRVGLAVSDELGLLASPAGCIVRRAGKRPPLAELERRAVALEAAGFVFGLPLDQAGEETPRSAEVRAVAATLAARQPRPVRLVDERFTTAAGLPFRWCRMFPCASATGSGTGMPRCAKCFIRCR